MCIRDRDSKNARSLMEKLSGLNRDEQATILMVTHDSNAASFCKRIPVSYTHLFSGAREFSSHHIR